ncbi:HECT-domain-containing protein [Dacryopinax primogenitus]|uniref:HECT-type E3 ubiquitin transferase n=1 Tax=Dacryopinax primogenitus (strain DJM 731) TaxID=1858805 RepID=M5FZ82_DACPD|nr:HECT-domain-containing protein [Dacryopinax primogenitus]EJT98881.1 HECT-domain-containing protein [Dacryopinax primogenitus]
MTILRHIPFTIPFDDRVFLFRQCVKQDKTSTAHADQSASFHPKPVRRHNLSEDGFDHFCSAETMLLKGRIRITFIDQDGHQEQGLDGGGLWKEFIVTLLEESFNPERGLWTKNEQEELYPFPQMFAREARQLKWYKFIGRMLGKALYDNILIDTVFATFFLAKWVGESGSLDSLASLDPYLHRALVALKQWESDDCLDPDTRFDIVDLDMGQPITTELVPNGSNVPVTKENRMKYIELVCKHRLDDQISEQTQAFLAGLRDLIELKWLKIFDASELQLLLSGVDRDVDVDDWMRNTAYEGGFSATDPCIHMFWTTVRALDRNEKRLLLRFVTSCSRPPLLGFGELKPKFTIRCASNDQNRLPTAATCFSTLKLPRYKEQEVMRNKLVQAITANAGFDLS